MLRAIKSNSSRNSLKHSNCDGNNKLSLGRYSSDGNSNNLLALLVVISEGILVISSSDDTSI